MHMATFGSTTTPPYSQLRAVGVGHLVTVDDAGEPDSTNLPFVVDVKRRPQSPDR